MENAELVYCDKCGELIASDALHEVTTDCGIEHWCDDCVESYATACAECGELFDSCSTKLVDVNDGYDEVIWCIDCADAHAHVCEHCGAYYTDESDLSSVTVRIGWHHNDVELWCADCVDSWAAECEDCGELFSTDCTYPAINTYDMWDGYERNICESCRDNYYWCDDCERLVHSDEAAFIGDNVYCPDCAENVRENDCFHDYHHTRAERFWIASDTCKCGCDLSDDERTALFIGVELETDNNDDAYSVSSDLIEAIGANRIECKRDGSLSSRGVEIVTQPMMASVHLESDMWNDIARIVRAHGGLSNDTRRCGLHVHLSRAGMVDDAVYRLDRLFHRFEYQMVRFSRRRGSELHWCAIGADNLKGIKDVEQRKREWAERKRYEGRYTAVNDTNSHTVEVRLWNGSLNVQTVKATIAFTVGLALVCNKITDEFADMLSWRELVALVEYQLVRARLPYTDLINYLAIRGL